MSWKIVWKCENLISADHYVLCLWKGWLFLLDIPSDFYRIQGDNLHRTLQIISAWIAISGINVLWAESGSVWNRESINVLTGCCMIKRLVTVFPTRTSFAVRFHILSVTRIKKLNQKRDGAEDFCQNWSKKSLIYWNSKAWVLVANETSSTEKSNVF